MPFGLPETDCELLARVMNYVASSGGDGIHKLVFQLLGVGFQCLSRKSPFFH
jgi:hypothetical protein